MNATAKGILIGLLANSTMLITTCNHNNQNKMGTEVPIISVFATGGKKRGFAHVVYMPYDHILASLIIVKKLISTCR